jgi:phosphoadenosine phosphosulfate reductase
MSLQEKTLFNFVDKEKNAIQIIQDLEPPEGYYLAFSGGKDSIVLYDIVKRAGVKFDGHHSLTTIDPPEVIYFMKKNYTNITIDRPEIPFLIRLSEKGFPLRQARWCCSEYKETGGGGRLVITGIRKAESNKRAGRKQVEFCIKDKTKRYLHPIIDFTDDDVWEYINKYNLKYCKLYDKGYKRIGCLFCPMKPKRERERETKEYPVYTKNFIKAFNRLYENKKDSWNMEKWENGEDMFWWWIREKKTSKTLPDQTILFE